MTRVRRPAGEARRAILEAAEKRLIEGGPDAVRVQGVAADLGVTDAAVYHHFGSRRGLLEALLRRAGRELREGIADCLADWNGEPAGLRRVAELIADVFAARGHARLALWLALSGWQSAGSGMFTPLVDAVHAARGARAREAGRPRPRREDAQHGVALLALALAADPIFGPGFLRSVDLAADADARARFRRFILRELERLLIP